MKNTTRAWGARIALTSLPLLLLATGTPATAQQRLLGIDVSAWQGEISAANWATLKRATDVQVGGIYGDGRDFVIIRSSRGGTTGYYDQNDPNNLNGLNTLSQRYDDPYYIQNITRATSAGVLAGSYHFARADIIATTPNSGGIANTGDDEADHMIQMAGPWMRPGYLLPVLDMEAGISQRSSSALTAFCIDFSDRIYEVMGIRPMIYVNGSYASYLQSSIVPAIPNLWSARWPNQSDPDSIPVQTGDPKDSYTPIYGPWDDPPYPEHPWKLWQYASTGRLNAIHNRTSNVDLDVAHGGIEFLKDLLIPALWVTNTSGEWTTLLNWNSGQTPIAPVQGPGQVPRVGPLTLPTPRLPANNDTVMLDYPGADVTITLSSGTQNIRKLYAAETLHITGGSLNINYVPSAESTPISAEFAAPVTLSNGASLKVHTLLVDAGQTFTLDGGTLSFNTIQLTPYNFTSGRISVGGDLNINSFSNSTATIVNGDGSGVSGVVILGGASRTFNVAGGADFSVNVPIVNGGIIKAGPGMMSLNNPNSYGSGTTVSDGTLLVNNLTGSGTGGGAVTVNGGRLGGTGSISGYVTVNSGGTLSPGTPATIGTLSFSHAPVFYGTNLVRIDRHSGSPLADSIVVSSGTLAYGGALVVANVGAQLLGGEVFTIFIAGGYSGAFTDTELPSLDPGLNWYLGDLLNNGSIKVNRSPVASSVGFTNEPGQVLLIPIATLVDNATDPDNDTLSLSSFDPTTTNGIALSTDGTSILYANDLSLPDQFNYVISDGHGGTATGVVQIVPSGAGRFAGSPLVDSNSVTLHLSGRPESTYYLERSTDLQVWTPISTNVAPADGLFDYTDDFHDLGEPPGSVFYRLRWNP